jgi:hypothetical protein
MYHGWDKKSARSLPSALKQGLFSASMAFVSEIGGVAEWFKAAVLKTAVARKGTVSSNLTSSAK